MSDRPVIRFKLRDHQRRVAQSPARWRCAVMHRRAGKSILCAGLLTAAATQASSGAQFGYVGPSYRQTKAIIWPALVQMAKAIGHTKINKSELAIEYANGAKVMLLGSENIDSLRGLYLSGCILDEAQMMAKSNWDFVVRPTLADRKGWAVITGTPAGRNNLLGWAFHNPEWESFLFRVGETDALDDDEIKDLQSQATDQSWAQEFLCDFDAAVDGAYYAPQVKRLWDRGGVRKISRDKRYPVIASVDLGHHDTMPVLFAQDIAGELRVFHVESYRFTAIPDMLAHIKHDLGINVDRFILPHDAQVRDLTSGMTRAEVFRNAGYDIDIASNVTLFEGIEQTRQAIDRLWIDEDHARILYDALAGYRSDKNEETGVTKLIPLHSWESHYADALRYLVLGERSVYTGYGDRDLAGLVT